MQIFTEYFDFDECRVAVAGLVDGRARIIGLVLQSRFGDVPDGVADLGHVDAVARPPEVADGRLTRVPHAADERHGAVFDRHFRIQFQRRVTRRI